MRRFTFKKVTEGEPARCYYCHRFNTLFALYDEKDMSEVFCCPECALKVGKIKRLKKLLGKYPLRERKEKNKQISLIKKPVETIPQVSTEPQTPFQNQTQITPGSFNQTKLDEVLGC